MVEQTQDNSSEANGVLIQSKLSKTSINSLIKNAKLFDDNNENKRQAVEFFSACEKSLDTNMELCDETAEGVQSSIPDIEQLKTNSKVFNGEYDNEKELRGELTASLHASALFGKMHSAIELVNSGYDELNKNIKEYRTRLIDIGVNAAQLKIKITDIDREQATKINSKGNSAGATVGALFSVVFVIAAMILCAYAVYEVMVGMIVLAVIFLIVWIYNGVMMTRHTQSVNNLVNRWYKEAIDYFQSNNSALKNSLEKQFWAMPFYVDYRNASEKWLKYKDDFDKRTAEVTEKLDGLCADFIKMIPQEFTDSKNLEALAELIETKRADNLKEAYAILESRYRENSRDEETKSFHDRQINMALRMLVEVEKQTQYAEQQAQHVERQAEYERRRAEAAERLAEYNAATAASAAVAASAAKRSAAAQEDTAKAAQKTAEEAERRRRIAEEVKNKL